MSHTINVLAYSILIASSLFLSSCATAKQPDPIPKTILVYPRISVEQGSCKNAPSIPDTLSTNELYRAYLEGVRLAGEDCRARLEALKLYLDNLGRE